MFISGTRVKHFARAGENTKPLNQLLLQRHLQIDDQKGMTELGRLYAMG